MFDPCVGSEFHEFHGAELPLVLAETGFLAMQSCPISTVGSMLIPLLAQKVPVHVYISSVVLFFGRWQRGWQFFNVPFGTVTLTFKFLPPSPLFYRRKASVFNPSRALKHARLTPTACPTIV